MSSRTTNLNLVKPSSDENVSLPVINGNYDTLDTEVAARVKTADIQNNLTSTATNKPLSAAQGKALSDTIVADCNRQTIASGTDLLTLGTNATANKHYYGANLSSMTNKPPVTVANGSFSLDVIYMGDYKFLLLYSYGSEIWINSQQYRSGVVWIGWQKIVTEGSHKDVSNLISWSTDFVTSVISCIAIKMINRVFLSATLRMKTGVQLQGAFIGTLGQGIQASVLPNLNAKFTKSDSQYANEIADVYLLNSTTIRISNDKTNASNVNGAQADNSLTIIGEWYTDQ